MRLVQDECATFKQDAEPAPEDQERTRPLEYNEALQKLCSSQGVVQATWYAVVVADIGAKIALIPAPVTMDCTGAKKMVLRSERTPS